MRTRPSSHGPPPKPPSSGIETAAATAAPASGPELVKSSAGVFQSPGFLDERCSELFRQLGAGLGL